MKAQVRRIWHKLLAPRGKVYALVCCKCSEDFLSLNKFAAFCPLCKAARREADIAVNVYLERSKP